MKSKNYVWLIVLASIVLIAVFIAGCSQTPKTIENKLNHTPETIYISFGEEFTLAEKDTAIVKDSNVSVTLTELVYAPCPKNMQCIWSGMGVFYTIAINGKNYTSDYDTPYDVIVGDTDYRTYADMVIKRADPYSECRSDNDCWRRFASRLNNVSYCSKITHVGTKNVCYADLAYKLNDTAICEKATNPTEYCLYLIITSQMKIEECDKVGTWTWTKKCYREIANKSNMGIEICDTIPLGFKTALGRSLRDSCKEMMSESY